MLRCSGKILEHAKYERINGEYYGEIPGCKGVWATGKTFAKCKYNLREVLKDWNLIKIK